MMSIRLHIGNIPTEASQTMIMSACENCFHGSQRLLVLTVPLPSEEYFTFKCAFILSPQVQDGAKGGRAAHPRYHDAANLFGIW